MPQTGCAYPPGDTLHAIGAGGGPGGPQYIIQLFVRGRIFDKHRDYGTQGLSYTFSTPAGARLGVFDISPRFMCPGCDRCGVEAGARGGR